MGGEPHDDRVMSLAIAHHMLQWAHLPEYQINQEPRPFTIDWFAARLQREEPRPREPIGSLNVR
jgi:hypothetical protein